MRQVVHTDAAPRAIGAYSQGVRCGGFLFVSGQIAIDPATASLTGGDVGAQTERVLKNAGEILMAGGATLETVVKTTVYLTDMAHFERMNEVYSLFFGDMPPLVRRWRSPVFRATCSSRSTSSRRSLRASTLRARPRGALRPSSGRPKRRAKRL